MKTLEELGKEYDMAQRVVLEKTIEITLFNNGVDPERVSMKDFDQLRRLSIEIDKINDRTSEAISKIQAAAQEEINAVVLQLEDITLKIKARQHAEDHPYEIKGETTVEQAPAADDGTAGTPPIIEELTPEKQPEPYNGTADLVPAKDDGTGNIEPVKGDGTSEPKVAPIYRAYKK